MEAIHLALLVALALAVAWWVWSRQARDEAVEPMPAGPPPLRAAPDAPPGIPLTLVDKIRRAVDTSIPTVVTSGAPVQYTDAEISQVATAALGRVNALGERLTLISVASASKTQDSYKNVAYELVVNAHDAGAGIGLLLAISLVVPETNRIYVRAMRLYNDAPDPMASLRTASDPPGHATFEDPLDLLAKFKVGATDAMPAQAPA